MKKRVAISCRVSTVMQAREHTVQSQLADLREICKDFEIVGEYIDEGWSGEVLARPALDQLRDDASKGLFEAVYFHSPDRLARKYAHQILILEEFKKRGIEVVFFDKPVSDDPQDKLLLGVQGVIAEYEKAKILERTRRGRLFKAKNGFVVGSIAPFGYTYIKKTFDKQGYYEVDKVEAEIVILIFDLYLQLKSIRAVARELTKRKIKPQKGYHWRQSTLRMVLKNESYIGTTYYNKSQGIEGENDGKYRKNVNSKRKYRDKKDWFPIQVPVILPKEKFHAVQVLLKKQHRSSDRIHFYLLGGSLIKCSQCSSSYAGENCHGKSFYRCNNRHKTFPLPRECKARMISAGRLDAVVWDALDDAVKNPNILVRAISLLVENTVGNQKLLTEEQVVLLKEKEKFLGKRNKLVDIYTDGGLPKEVFFAKKAEIDVVEKIVDEKLGVVNQKLTQSVDRPLLIKAIHHFCGLAKARLKTSDPVKRKEFLSHILDKIVLDLANKKALISGCVPVLVPVQSGMMATTSTNYARQRR